MESKNRAASVPVLPAESVMIKRETRSEELFPITGILSTSAQPHFDADQNNQSQVPTKIEGNFLKVQCPSSAASPPIVKQEETDPAMGTTASKHTSMSVDFSKLRQEIVEASATELEAFVQRSSQVLLQLSSELAKIPDNTEATRRLRSIEDLKGGYKAAHTIIGIVGDTGAGKSSLINDLVGEDKIVPSNCMRACTAVPTEISWNDSALDNERYRAEIDFITRDDWQSELQHLFTDLIDSSGQVKSATNKETEAGIAWFKIQSVYPGINLEKLALTDAANLAWDKSTRDYLGTSEIIHAPTASGLYKQLQQYIDSKEKTKGQGEENSRSLALWPLIKVVRVYLKSDVLSTGIVLVDLPGVGDSNAARASVARKYLEKCNSIWVVAPIVRAVDNKTAQNLLGESFKMQMKLDGRFSNISFICSQTDNIMVNDAVDSLGLQEDHEQLISTMDSFKKQRPEMEAEFGHLEILCKDELERFNILEKTLKTWDNLRAKNAAGKRVFAPASTSGKRKPRAPKTNVTNKRRKAQRRSLLPESDIEEEEEEADEPSGNASPLTTEQINDKISQLKEEKRKTREKLYELEAKSDNIQDHLDSLQHEYENSQQQFLALCIKKRNEYSREAIQNQFAHGIQILDQETAMKEDGDNFNPDVHARDYKSTARSLEVFCVSSRAYKALKGTPKEKEDIRRAGYFDPEQTEIPQLIAYAKKLTNDCRIANYSKFINTCLQICQSLGIWLGAENTEVTLPQDQAEILDRKTTEVLIVLRKDIKAAAKKSADDCKEVFEKEVIRKFVTAGTRAAKAVPAIAEKWGAPQQQNGYHFGVYRAVCVRRGAYSSPKYGRIDFNEKLCYPFMKELAASWEKAFTRDIPKVLEGFYLTSQRLMEAFHDRIQNHLQHPGASERIKTLRPQLATYVQTIKDGQSDFGQKVQQWQRESSRELAPGIKTTLEDVYDECRTIRGTGSFTRMKRVIEDGVETYGRDMYMKASKTATGKLRTMCSDYGAILDEQIDNTIDNMTSDYIGSIRKQTVNAAPEDVRRDIIEILQSFS
ncbi:hypothetical protein SCAR479_13908 [Seiridium cardinale]|uniref:Nuclear GTPase SLIP-GC n=1 Tax=Seiridium cardinale TaxID=138064 RepID=A0ABR2X6L6_9PEZI